MLKKRCLKISSNAFITVCFTSLLFILFSTIYWLITPLHDISVGMYEEGTDEVDWNAELYIKKIMIIKGFCAFAFHSNIVFIIYMKYYTDFRSKKEYKGCSKFIHMITFGSESMWSILYAIILIVIFFGLSCFETDAINKSCLLDGHGIFNYFDYNYGCNTTGTVFPFVTILSCTWGIIMTIAYIGMLGATIGLISTFCVLPCVLYFRSKKKSTAPPTNKIKCYYKVSNGIQLSQHNPQSSEYVI